MSDDTQYVALVVTKRHKLYGITVRNQLSNLRSFTNESYDVFAVSYDPNGKGIYWLSSFGVFRTSLGGNDTNMIYRTSVWNPCQWIKVLPKRALIVVGCDYTLTAIGYTGATLLK